LPEINNKALLAECKSCEFCFGIESKEKNLEAGEIDIYSCGGADIKLDKNGEIILNSSTGASVNIKNNVEINNLEVQNLNISGKSLNFLTIYPVGSLYFNINNINPESLFGGTWVLWGSGRVPVCVDSSDFDFNTSEKTGGNKSITLTTSQIPAHKHRVRAYSTNQDSGYIPNDNDSWGSITSVGASDRTAPPMRTANAMENTGDNQAHSNLQPFITCYIWKRTV